MGMAGQKINHNAQTVWFQVLSLSLFIYEQDFVFLRSPFDISRLLHSEFSSTG